MSEWREWFRRHERAIAVAWLAGAAVVCVGAAVEPVRGRALELADGLLRRWDDRWSAQVREARRLVTESRWTEAEALLERLDAAHPATNVRHGRDKEREEVLRLLARTYEALDKRGRTIDTYERLVAFDPRHYRNAVALAEASDRLLSRATTAVEARDAWAEALRLFPAHLPSVRGTIGYYLDRGEFPEAVDAYERYLDAYLEQPLTLTVGDVTVQVSTLVDGLEREYDVALPRVAGDVREVRLSTGGFPVGIARLELLAALPAGRPATGARTSLTAGEGSNAETADSGRRVWVPASRDAALAWAVSEPGVAISSVRLRIAIYKPADRALWTAVARSYRNLLDAARLQAAAARTVTYTDAADADAVLDGPYWASQGLYRGEDGVQD